MRLAADLDVAGRRVVVCGGSPAALGVITDLHAAGAVITVYRPDVCRPRFGTWPTLLDHLAAAAWSATISPTRPGGPRRRDRPRRTAHRGGGPASPVDCASPPATPTRPRPGVGVGHVTLVGGGPGDPGLLTVAGLAAIKSADVIICDRLAPWAALSAGPAGVEIIDVAKIPRGEYTPQERINELLVEHARAGQRVVRLKGGDNFIFGRGGEELLACAEAGVPVTVIPGSAPLSPPRPWPASRSPTAASPRASPSSRRICRRTIRAAPWTGRRWPAPTPRW